MLTLLPALALAHPLTWDQGHSLATAPVAATKEAAVSFADLDGDGDWDAIVPGDRSFELLENDGSHAFTVAKSISYPAGQNHRIRGVFPADLDNDGDVDLFVARERSVEVVWNGGGSIDVAFPTQALLVSEATLPASYEGAGLADLDHDGVLEALAAHDGELHTFVLDLGTTTYGPPLVFDMPSVSASDFLAVADIDSDGMTDVVVRGSTRLIHLEYDGVVGDWAAREPTTGLNANDCGNKGTVAFCDTSTDGTFELFWSCDALQSGDSDNTPIPLDDDCGDGFPSYCPASEVPAAVDEGGNRGTQCGDLDHDGDLELVVADDGDDAVWDFDGAAWVRDGVGGSNALTLSPALADWDDDGDLDVLVHTMFTGLPRVFLNTDLDPGVVDAYLQVRVQANVGTCEDPVLRDDIGAQVRVFDEAGLTLVAPLAEVFGGTGRGQIPWPVLHIGGVVASEEHQLEVRTVFPQATWGRLPVQPDTLGSPQRLVIRADDIDGDGIPNDLEPDDTDNDGRSDAVELDSDGDGCLDATEAGANPCTPDEGPDGPLAQDGTRLHPDCPGYEPPADTSHTGVATGDTAEDTADTAPHDTAPSTGSTGHTGVSADTDTGTDTDTDTDGSAPQTEPTAEATTGCACRTSTDDAPWGSWTPLFRRRRAAEISP